MVTLKQSLDINEQFSQMLNLTFSPVNIYDRIIPNYDHLIPIDFSSDFFYPLAFDSIVISSQKPILVDHSPYFFSPISEIPQYIHQQFLPPDPCAMIESRLNLIQNIMAFHPEFDQLSIPFSEEEEDFLTFLLEKVGSKLHPPLTPTCQKTPTVVYKIIECLLQYQDALADAFNDLSSQVANTLSSLEMLESIQEILKTILSTFSL